MRTSERMQILLCQELRKRNPRSDVVANYCRALRDLTAAASIPGEPTYIVLPSNYRAEAARKEQS